MMFTRLLRNFFWNEHHGRARAPWLILVPLVGAYAAILLAEAIVPRTWPRPLVQLLVNGVAVPAAILLVMASRRYLGARRSLVGYGLAIDRRWLVDLVAGLGIGLAAVGVPFAVGLSVGWLQVEAVLDRAVMPLWTGIGLMVLAYVCTGFWEELVLRGVFLCNAADGLRRWLSPRGAVAGGLVLSAVVFGLGHLAQPEVPAFILTWILAGIVLGAIYVFSGNLALAIGTHTTFNIAHNVIFVRTDLPGTGDLSAVMRIGVDPTVSALAPGGLIDAAAFVSLGVLALLWLRYSRGTVRLQLRALDLETPPQRPAPAPTPVA